MDNDISGIKQYYKRAIQTWENVHGKEWRNNNIDKTMQLDEILYHREMWFCTDNPRKKILLSMLNPSGEKGTPFPFKDILKLYDPNKKKDFWRPWMEILKEYVCSEMVAHIDLFPVREGNQNIFRSTLPNELKAELLRVTQREIERLEPELIIHANKSTGFYYGTNPKHPWMGYVLQRIYDSDLDTKGDLYVIKGLLNDYRRILYPDSKNDGLNSTSMEGKYLYVCYQQTGRCVQNNPQLSLNKKDIDILVEKYTNL